MSTKVKELKVKNEVKMSIIDIINLNGELQAMNKEKEVNFVTKYKIIVLFEITKRIVERFNTTKLELFQKYGKEDPKNKGSFSLRGASAANYGKGMAELEELSKVEETFTDHSFNIKDFENIKSEVGYIQFFKFLEA